MMACARRFKAAQAALAAGQWGRPRGMAVINDQGVVGRALARRLTALARGVVDNVERLRAGRPLRNLARAG